jgi:LAO/AO transport system kinase
MKARQQPPDIEQLARGVRAGDRAVLARAITLIESKRADHQKAARALVQELLPQTGRAVRVGITGAPGVGKSTTTSALVRGLRARGERVGVLAVDPSSPFTGGALLGDRIRMQDHALDPGVFIRSMATRGHLGGLAWATPQAVRVLDGAGVDVVVVETVGVGQSEVEVAGLADVTVVLLAPGMGDGVQAAKAGILEVGDVFVVNKADRDGVQATVRDLRHMISLGMPHGPRGEGEPPLWRPPVLTTVASTGQGIDELLAELDRHHDWATTTGALRDRRLRRAEREIEAIAVTALRERMADVADGHRLGELAEEVVDARIDPYAAADDLMASVVG